MGSYTKGAVPVTCNRGRAFSMPMRWADPEGSPIDITLFQIAAKLTWKKNEHDMDVVVTNASEGRFTVRLLDTAITAQVPLGNLSMINVVVTDDAADIHEFDLPVNGVS